MAVAFSRNVQMSHSKEATYNTYIATGHEGVRVLPGMKLSMDRDIREEITARGIASLSPYDITNGLRRWSLTFSASVPKEGIAFWLSYVLGNVTTSAVTAFYKHIIKPNNPALGTDSTPPSVSLRILDDNREWHLSGGVVTSLKVAMALDNFWKLDVEMIGGSYVDATVGSAVTYATVATGRQYLVSDDFEFWVNTATGSAANWLPTNWEITFKRSYAEGATESYQSGSAERVRLVSAGAPALEVTGMTRRIYDGYTEFDLFDAFTQFRLELRNKVVAGENLVAVDTAGYAIKWMIEKCYLRSWEVEDSAGLMMQKLDWRATYTTGNDLSFTVQDGNANPASMGTA